MNKPNQDLYLKYKFTDRGGQHVFDIYHMPANMEIMQRPENIVGEIRMEPDWEDAVTVEAPADADNDDQWLCTNGNAHIIDSETGVCQKCGENVYSQPFE
jgi:hypothetical protein